MTDRSDRAEASEIPDETWQDALKAVLAGLLLDRTGSPELIAWATLALSQGQETPGLRRLAAAYPQEPLSETRPVFERCLLELGHPVPEGDRLLSDYAATLAEKILAGKLPPPEGLARMAALNYARKDWDPLLIPVCDLQSALELLPDGLNSYAWLYPEFQQMPLQELIKEECRLYLALRPLQLPVNLMRSNWCLGCGRILPPGTVRAPENWLRRFWRRWREGTVKPFQCPDCGSQEHLPLATLAGRRRYLTKNGLTD